MSNDESTVPLPLLIYANPSSRLELFAKKIKFCCSLCDFNDSGADLKKKEMKRIYLNECIEFLKDKRGILIEPIYALTFALFGHNIFRTLPIKRRIFDPDFDEHNSDPAWSHLRLVYLLFIGVLESPDFQPSKAKKFIDQSFLCRVIETFASDDQNEREMLRTTLHRIYAKFITFRAFLRREIGFQIQHLIYEDCYFPGITELLEVVGSIVNGLVAPIKAEHVRFLHQILIPLHSLPKIDHFHPQLCYCVIQYFKKDANLIENFFRKFFKRWPKTCTCKEMLFLDELEELIDIAHPAEVLKIQDLFFAHLSASIISNNSQISERALVFFHNEYILSLVEANAKKIFPLILPSLVEASNYHWNRDVARLATSVVENFVLTNQKLFEEVTNRLTQKKKEKEEKELKRTQMWNALEREAQSNQQYETYIEMIQSGNRLSVFDSLPAIVESDTYDETTTTTGTACSVSSINWDDDILDDDDDGDGGNTSGDNQI